MSNELEHFLRKRNICEEVIQNLKAEKIDKQAISVMSDQDLASYIQHHGDRVAVKGFCKTASSHKDKKQPILENLIQKLKSRAHDYENDSDLDRPIKKPKQNRKLKLMGNENAKKELKRVDIGWIINDGKDTVQIRTKQGGGTRNSKMFKTATKKDLVKEGLRLFFPEGVSRRGKAEDFDFDLWDFMENSVEDNVTLQEMYYRLKMPLIRVYLASTLKTAVSRKESKNPNEQISDKQPDSSSELSIVQEQLNSETEKDQCVLQSGTPSDGDCSIIAAAANFCGITEASNYSFDDKTSLVNDLDEISNIDFLADSDDEVSLAGNSLFVINAIATSEANKTVTRLNNTSTPVNLANEITSTNKTLPVIENVDSQNVLVNLPAQDMEESEIQFGPFDGISDIDTTLPYFDVPTRTGRNMSSRISRENTPVKRQKNLTIVVHEGNIMMELISFFKDSDTIDATLTIRRANDKITPELEQGEGSGMERDVFTEFWQEFYENCTTGCSFKIPITRHDF